MAWSDLRYVFFVYTNIHTLCLVYGVYVTYYFALHLEVKGLKNIHPLYIILGTISKANRLSVALFELDKYLCRAFVLCQMDDRSFFVSFNGPIRWNTICFTLYLNIFNMWYVNASIQERATYIKNSLDLNVMHICTMSYVTQVYLFSYIGTLDWIIGYIRKINSLLL